MRNKPIRILANGACDLDDQSEGRVWVVEHCLKEPTPNDAKKHVASHESPVIYCSEEGHFLGIAMPLYSNRDVYYARKDDALLLSDDLIALASALHDVSIAWDEVWQLIEKGYCKYDRTLFREIRRFPSYTLSTWTGGSLDIVRLPIEQITWDDDEDCYQDFRKRIDGIIDRELNGESNHVLLLSGGADSRLIFLNLLKRGVRFSARTSLVMPVTHIGNASDVYIAQKVCQDAKVPFECLTYEHADYPVDDIGKMAVEIPLSPHALVGFLTAFELRGGVSSLDPSTYVWTGQNMDTLYNLGPTDRFTPSFHGVSQWLKRFYTSEEFFASLDDVYGDTTLSTAVTARVGLRINRLYHHRRDLSLPTTSFEVVERFRSVDGDTVLAPVKMQAERLQEPGKKLRALQVKQLLLDSKIDHLNGGDPRSISLCARLTHTRAVFPYTSVDLFDWFMNYPLRSKDANEPKRMVYRAIRDLSQEMGVETLAQFPRLKASQLASMTGNKPVSLLEFEQKAIRGPWYGKMREETNQLFITSLVGLNSFAIANRILRSFWVTKVYDAVIERGVSVKTEGEAHGAQL